MEQKARPCQTCERLIPAYSTAYTLRVQLYAEAGTVYITPDDLHQDHQKALKQLYEDAANSDPQELMDEVFESYTLTVCPRCRRELHEHLNRFVRHLKDDV